MGYGGDLAFQKIFSIQCKVCRNECVTYSVLKICRKNLQKKCVHPRRSNLHMQNIEKLKKSPKWYESFEKWMKRVSSITYMIFT